MKLGRVGIRADRRERRALQSTVASDRRRRGHHAAGRHAGLLHFTVAGVDPTDVEQELLRRDVLVRSMETPRCIRASTGFYNNDADLKALAEALREILAAMRR